MTRQTNVRSIDALRTFRVALLQYAEALQEALDTLTLESQRTVEWFHFDRMNYWPAEIRRAADALNEALSVLQIKQTTTDGSNRPAATEERNDVQLAKQRLRLTEEKKRQTKQAWQQVQHQSDEYRGTLGKLAQLIECDIPAAVAVLDRKIAALDKYTSIQPAAQPTRPAPSGINSLPTATDSPQNESKQP